MSHSESSHTCSCGGNCACQTSQQAQPVYLTREEYVDRLERYLVDLKTEIELVEKELLELKTPAVLAKV